MRTTIKLLMILSLLLLTECRRRRKRCPPGYKNIGRGRCAPITGSTTGVGLSSEYDNGLRILQQRLEQKLKRKLIIPCYAFDLPRGPDCYRKTPLDFEGGTTTTYCEVCEIFDDNKKQSYDYDLHLDSDKTQPIWIFSSYTDNTLCSCGAGFIYHSRVNQPGRGWDWERANDFFARQIEPQEKQCLESEEGYINQPIFWRHNLTPYKNGSKHTYGRGFTAWGYAGEGLENPEVIVDASIPGPDCKSRPDISSMFAPQPPYYPPRAPPAEGCVREGVYLAWFKGEPLAEHLNSDEARCGELCRENHRCHAWTLNTNNGWCALKRKDQVKEQTQQGFVSGYKTCPRN